MTEAWPVRLSPEAAKYLAAHDRSVQELVRDVLDIASRTPWGWPQWDATDPEGEDLRVASVGPLVVVYWINRAREHLYAMDIVWSG
ncbi:hypothetical protein ACFWPU_45530 [Streptomyces sp. NPDC058471]|uniref:hypothetical protein n=1 Tax=Streptomyces sp. NPDC058471 TaxID=3346516 RepID=UPI00365BF086